MDHQYPHDQSRTPSTVHWVMLGFIAIIGFFLITEHRAHLYGALPYVILLACPIMHLFMHRGHGGQSDGSSISQDHPEKGGDKG